ncbi:helix-turn-helix domain-containing protein [Pelagimonas varians]|uniref:Helix-turn-helix domain protein n=1 Tax=Pelagimonas varians TaxID=696760 RepID=A0A238K741_9RHOB|nr:helix-turn-helix domain-containing protein [Pelagimonas varians]PYG31728.1 excisionase family DNA binding protein [Pelagimonas varians]SMX38698.1 Helix-turn-helix domain protein [Pelagimonas varians]
MTKDPTQPDTLMGNDPITGGGRESSEATAKVAKVDGPLTYSATSFGKAVGLSKDSIRSLIRQKRLKALKVGRRWVIPRSELERFMAEIEALQIEPFATSQTQANG